MQQRREHIRLPGQMESVPAGRHFLTLMLAECGLAALTDAVALAASEMLTNAVLHARTPIEVGLQVGEQLVVFVHDQAPPWTQAAPATPGHELPEWDSESGRGLALIAAVTDAWGVRPEPPGKVVWFSLVLPAADLP